MKLKVSGKFDRGERSIDIQREMGLHDSTVRTICDNRDKIHKSIQTTINLSVTRTARSRLDAIEKMTKMLITWIEHQNQENMPLYEMDIQEKARSLYGDQTKDTNDPMPFTASDGLFMCFKSRHAFHNLKLTGEAAAEDHAAVIKFPAVFKSVIADGGFTPSQVFKL